MIPLPVFAPGDTGVASAAPPQTITRVGATNNQNNGTAYSVTQPAGYQAGDVGILLLAQTYAGMSASPTSQGWTQLQTDVCAFVYYKVYGASEASPTGTGTVSGGWVMALEVYRAVNTSSPIQASSVLRTGAGNTSYPSTALTSTSIKSQFVSALALVGTNGSVVETVPAGMTSRSRNRNGPCIGAIADVAGPAASGGSTGTTTWTGNQASVYPGSTVINVLLNPAPA